LNTQTERKKNEKLWKIITGRRELCVSRATCAMCPPEKERKKSPEDQLRNRKKKFFWVEIAGTIFV
jgi:hypothetical protein